MDRDSSGGSRMTEVVLYHHVQGLTDGVRTFAHELRRSGHTVHTPDLFDGRTFGTLEEGMAFAREAGVGALAERGVAAAEGLGARGVARAAARVLRLDLGAPRRLRRLRRLLVRGQGRPAARPDPPRRPR